MRLGYIAIYSKMHDNLDDYRLSRRVSEIRPGDKMKCGVRDRHQK